MDTFFEFFELNASGVLLALLCLMALIASVHWMAWIFGVGRFVPGAQAQARTHPLRYLITEALTKIINDFRHLLALILVVIFGLALAYALYQTAGDMDKVKEALQAVTATLGGLVGSIIGYYFGESKASLDAGGKAPLAPPPPAVQGDTTDPTAPPVLPAQPRPNSNPPPGGGTGRS